MGRAMSKQTDMTQARYGPKPGEPTRGQPLSLSIATPLPELPERARGLSPQLQELVVRYIGAQHRHGETLLEAAHWMHEAKQAADYGDWRIFLKAIGESEDTAERLLNIYDRAIKNPQFAESVRTGQIGKSAAALLAAPSTPAQIIDQALNAPEPMKVKEIESAIKDAKPSKQPKSPEVAAPVPGDPQMEEWWDVKARWETLGWDLTTRGDLRYRLTPIAGGVGIDNMTWYSVLTRLEAQERKAIETQVTTPAAPSAAPFWQALDAHHPSAHLWTRTRPDLLQSACGMTMQNRVPSGATDASHCSSCVRATWVDAPDTVVIRANDPAPPAEPAIQRARCTIDDCDRPGVGSHQTQPQGPWLWFCDQHAPVIAALNNYPRQPASADASAVLDYNERLKANLKELRAAVRSLLTLPKGETAD